MQADKINEVFEEMRKAHTVLKQTVEKQIGDLREDPILKAQAEKANSAITALQEEVRNLATASKRNIPSGSDSDVPEEELVRRSAFEKLIRYGKGENSAAGFTADERSSLSGTSDADGGSLVPTSFESEVITEAYNAGELRNLVQASPTGRDTVYLSSMSKPRIAWDNRGLCLTPQELATGGERIEVNSMRALITISNNTLDDAEADVWGELRRMFGEAIGEGEDDAIIAGSGVGCPQGILSHDGILANVSKTGVASALSNGSINGIDVLINMLYSLNKKYRRNAVWMMNSATEGILRTLKNDNGDYLWQPPVQAGAPALFLGHPIANPEAMPDVVAGSIPIALGDIKAGYKLRDRKNLTVQRLTEKFADCDETGFIIKKRLGGQPVLAEAFRVLKVAV